MLGKESRKQNYGMPRKAEKDKKMKINKGGTA